MINNLWLAAAGIALAACGCSERASDEAPTASNTNAAASQSIRAFQVRGIVVAYTPGETTVRIKHEEIPDYMPAMTMPFTIRDTNEMSGIKAGDAVQFRLNVTENDDWIDQLRKAGPGSPAADATSELKPPGETGLFRRVRDVEPLEIGDVLPEYHFTNQLGQPFSTSQFRGRAVAITFIFTRCPLPTFCPRMGQNFAKAQERLRADTSAPSNWHFLTLSFDPEFDRPAVLKQYAEAQNYDPTRWTFGTGSLIDLTAIGEQFGLAFWRDDSGSINHNLRTAVIDPAGRVHKVFDGNTWTGEELAAEISAAAAKANTQAGA